jgi:RNA recognition motif-containing protein
MNSQIVKNIFVHISSDKIEFRKSCSVPSLMRMFLEEECDLSQKCQLSTCDTASTVSSEHANDLASPTNSSCNSSTGSESQSQKKKRSRRAKVFPTLPEDKSSFSTLMVRNIPCKYTQEQLLAEVRECSTKFDFLHLPVARTLKANKNLGYAFINFTSPEEARSFMVAFQDRAFQRFPKSTKQAHVDYAQLQGFNENVAFFKRSKITSPKSHFRCCPFVNEQA